MYIVTCIFNVPPTFAPRLFLHQVPILAFLRFKKRTFPSNFLRGVRAVSEVWVTRLCECVCVCVPYEGFPPGHFFPASYVVLVSLSDGCCCAMSSASLGCCSRRTPRVTQKKDIERQVATGYLPLALLQWFVCHLDADAATTTIAAGSAAASCPGCGTQKEQGERAKEKVESYCSALESF